MPEGQGAGVFGYLHAPALHLASHRLDAAHAQALGRLAPDAEGLTLLTGILLLPYHNPVDVAEQTVTLDHISNGRFVLGVGLGYREAELSAFGTNRRDRVARFEESVELMKLLWSGEEVNYQGRHWQVNGARLALTPRRNRIPPSGSPRRVGAPSAELRPSATGLFWGLNRGGRTSASLSRQYKEALEELGKDPAGRTGAHRSIAIARDRETAITEAREMAAKKAGVYASFNMQENTTVDLGLGGQRELQDWAVAGRPGGLRRNH